MFVRFIRTWSHALRMKNRKYFCLAHPLRKYGSSAAQDRTSPLSTGIAASGRQSRGAHGCVNVIASMKPQPGRQRHGSLLVDVQTSVPHSQSSDTPSAPS
jgi:hypothetical protein